MQRRERERDRQTRERDRQKFSQCVCVCVCTCKGGLFTNNTLSSLRAWHTVDIALGSPTHTHTHGKQAESTHSLFSMQPSHRCVSVERAVSTARGAGEESKRERALTTPASRYLREREGEESCIWEKQNGHTHTHM